MTAAQGARLVCDICNRSYGAKYLTTHRRKEHGIRGGHTGIVRRTAEEMNGDKPPPRRGRLRPEPKKNPGTGRTAVEEVIEDRRLEVIAEGRGAWKELAPKPQLSFKVGPFVVLEDNEGGIWLAERIR